MQIELSLMHRKYHIIVLLIIMSVMTLSCGKADNPEIPTPPPAPADTVKGISELIIGEWVLIDELPEKLNDVEYSFKPDGTFTEVKNGYTNKGTYSIHEEDERYYERNKDSAYMHTADNQRLPYTHYVHFESEKWKKDFGVIIIDTKMYLSLVHVYSIIPQKYIFQRKGE